MRETFQAMLVLVAILFFGAVEFGSCRNTSFSCLEGEREALLKLKLCFDDSSHMLSSWKGNDCCEWRGVRCDKNSKHVVSLQLRGSIFDQHQMFLVDDVEEVVSSLLKLRYLEHLDLSRNDFNRSLIPPSFGLMKQLRYLNLSNAQFRGRIPSELGNLTKLRVLDLSQYNYRGLKVDDDIQWISHLSSLQRLDMSGGNLSLASSNLFQVLGMLSSLSWLSLSDCDLKNSHLPSCNHPLNFTFLGNMQHFDISWNSFHGPIPIFLQNMTSLTFLDISGANLSLTSSNWFQVLGMLPSLSCLRLSRCSLKSYHLPSNNHPLNFTLLSNIQHLDLSWNFFLGPIPIFLQKMTSLMFLDLSHNQLSGSIPDGIGQLSKLKSIYLSHNQLSGSIPNSIGQLSNLEGIYLSANQLSGSIPNSIGQLSNLEELHFSSNKLNGVLPNSIGKLSNLQTLGVEFNSLEGVISEAHFANLSNLISLNIGFNNLNCEMISNWKPPLCLEYIYMGSCKFGTGFPKWLQLIKTAGSVDLSNASISGPLPKNIVNMMPKLGALYLANNLMNGSIPRSLCNSEVLISLDLSNNMFSGNIPKSLCNSKSLEHLDLSNNMLFGSIPNCWRHDQLFNFIDLSSNNLSGLFPSTMGRLFFLNMLYLNNNSLHKELPVALKNCTSLVVLDLGENKFSGNLTSIVRGKISNHSLKVLRLRKNLVSGYIPLELCSFSQLQILDLADNNLTGMIPPCFGKFSMMVNATQLFNRMNNILWQRAHLVEVVKGRSLEYAKKTLALGTMMDLSRNNLVGSIPEELIFLKELHSLNLSWNHLSGEIPENIGHMENLESLDFSQNNLSGMIPNSMSSLTKLSHLNLSYNNLSGPIPIGYQLQTLEDPTIYTGNPQLCGAPLLKKCSNDVPPPIAANSKDDDEGALEKMWFYIVVMSGFATGFWGVVGTLIFVKSWRYAYFQWVDDVKDWILVVITLKMVKFKKMFNGNPNN